MSKVNFFTEYLRLALWRACMIFMNMFSQCTFYLPTHSSRKLGVLSDHFNAKMPIQNQTVLIGFGPMLRRYPLWHWYSGIQRPQLSSDNIVIHRSTLLYFGMSTDLTQQLDPYVSTAYIYKHLHFWAIPKLWVDSNVRKLFWVDKKWLIFGHH